MDPFTIMALASGASSLIGGAMGNDDPNQLPTKIEGFAALPQEVKDAYLKQFLPGVLAQYQNGPNPGPLGRARTGRYDSRGMQELQAYADRLVAQQNSPEAQAQRQAQAAAQSSQSQVTNPDMDRQRETQLRNTYMQLNPGFAKANGIGMNNDWATQNAFNDPRLDFWTKDKGYQDWRNAFAENQQSAPQPQQMGNAFAGNPVMGGQAMPMGGMGQQGMAGTQQGMGDQLGGNLGVNGVRPIPGIEQFNPMQERAFDEIQQFQPNSIASYANPYATGALNQLGQLAQFNPNNKPVTDYMTDYYDQVTNRGLNRLGKELDKSQNSLFGEAARRGGNAFNSSATAIMLAELKNASQDRALDFIANQNQANFGQARDQRNLEIGRRDQYLNNLVSGGNDTFRIAGGLQAVGNDQRRQSLQDLLAAGNQVQNQGQAEINAANPLIQQQLPQNRLNQLGTHLGMFPQSGESFDYTPGEQNMFTKIGNAGMGFAGLHQGYHDQRGTPWLGAFGGSPGIGGMSGGRIGSLGGYL